MRDIKNISLLLGRSSAGRAQVLYTWNQSGVRIPLPQPKERSSYMDDCDFTLEELNELEDWIFQILRDNDD